MGVEGGDLVDLGQRQSHLVGERRQMRGRKIAVVVLDEVQMLDQQIAPAIALVQQRPDLRERRRVDLPALGSTRRAAPACGGGAPIVPAAEGVTPSVRAMELQLR